MSGRENIDISASLGALRGFVGHSLDRSLEPLRLARVMTAMLFVATAPNVRLLGKSAEYLRGAQLSDGGWSDPEETAWASAVISEMAGGNNEAVVRANGWLNSIRHPGGGWGRHPRDMARIPTTALVLTLLPVVALPGDIAWVRNEWRRDLSGTVKLSYKGAFYLLSEAVGEHADGALLANTVNHLEQDQNDDGGFGPWKDHPIGSDPWSTGVVLWGLSKWIDKVNPEVIEKALRWLEKTQLPSGYWPYHYLDEGTSYALIGAAAAIKALENKVGHV
jgi:hypothetical protein